MAPDFKQHALIKHRTVAVLPFYIEYQEKGSNIGDAAAHEQYLRSRRADRLEDSYALQGELVDLLQHKKRRLSFRVQDTAETNRLLRQSGISWDSLDTQPRGKLAQIAHVDVILTPYAGVSQAGPPSGVIWAVGITTGLWFANKGIATGFLFHDAQTGSEACRCHCNIPGTVGDDSEALAGQCFDYMIRGLPYRARHLRRAEAKAAKKANMPASSASR